MLNWLAKFLLVASSLAPALGAVAVINSGSSEWVNWAVPLGAAVALVVCCWGMLAYAATNAERYRVEIAEFERTDQEVLAFLLAYLLPFISAEGAAFTKHWLVGGYILAMIMLVVAHVGAFHFNPVMWLLGYHFYAVKDRNGISQVLISREKFRRAGERVETVRLAHNIYLQTGSDVA